ncbi:MAG: hypothetical protein K2W85_14675 [Phycisphaerales bacterium]|nr:hypothetical protein [Phycisphaerales bacterium]
MTSVNLIPQQTRQKQAAARRRSAWARGLRAYAVLAAGVALIGQLPTRTEATAVDHTGIARAERRMENAARGREQVRAMLAEARSRLETSKAVGHHPDWSVVLELLTRSRVEGTHGEIDAVLQSVEILPVKQEPAARPAGSDTPRTPARKPTVEKYSVRVVGFSPTPARVYRYVLRLEQLGVFDGATVRDTRAEKMGDLSATRFELDIVLSGAMAETSTQTGDRK